MGRLGDFFVLPELLLKTLVSSVKAVFTWILKVIGICFTVHYYTQWLVYKTGTIFSVTQK